MPVRRWHGVISKEPELTDSTIVSWLGIFLPCSLFALSLWAVFHQASTARNNNLSDMVWAGLYALVNVMATFWSAGVLSSQVSPGVLTPSMQATSLSVGPYLYVTLGGFLVARKAGGLACRWTGTLFDALKRNIDRVSQKTGIKGRIPKQRRTKK